MNYSDHPTNLPRLEVARTNTHKLSIDKLRVDLMRSELAVKEAEGRALRYEHELNEIKKKYLFAQNALKDRSRMLASGGARNQLPPGERGGTAQEQIEAIQRRKAMVRDAETARSEGSDSLPPMAAALFAQAEREEREKQRREQRMGMVEEVVGEEDEEVFNLVGFNRAVVDLRRENEKAITEKDENVKDEAVSGNVIDEAESFQRALLGRRLNGVQEPAASSVPIFSSEIMDDVVYDTSSPTEPDDRYQDARVKDLQLENESLGRARQALRSKLAHSENLRRAQAVEHEKSVSSGRMLRAEQSDWTRRLAEARQESDAKEKELAKRHKADKEEWSAEVVSLGQQLNGTVIERDELKAQLEVQSTDIRHVTRLLWRLVLNRFQSFVADLVPKSKQAKGQLSHKMMSVGGGDSASQGRTEGRLAIEHFVQRIVTALRNLRREMARLLNSGRGERTNELSGDEAPLLLKLPNKSRLLAPKEIFRPRRSAGEDDERGELPQFLQQDR